jgi:hypothetical protein
MARVAGALVLVATLGAVAPGAQAPQTEIKSIKGFETFQRWSQLVWAHKPGELDASVRTIAAWRDDEVAQVRSDIWAVATLVSRGAKPGSVIRYTGFEQELSPTRMGLMLNPRTVRMADVPDLICLPPERRTSRINEPGITQFMKLAAMLHTDVVMLSEPPSGTAKPRAGFDRSIPAGRITDGEVTGWDAGPVHWEIGRAALRAVRPLAKADPWVAVWYRATSAYLVARRQYGYLESQLAEGREILPDDPKLHVYAGALHEAYASPVLQEARGALSSGGFNPTAESRANELEHAERDFRRALELDPALDIVRVHLGRVMGLRGRHGQAASELRRALSSLADPRQRYYAELFLGAEEQASGRTSEAKNAFDRASLLFPNAQAPHLALGQLAWQTADRAGADAAFERLAALPRALADREDPWWTYSVSAVLDVATLVETMRALVGK